MPLYEYQCDNCGNQFELIRKFSDPPVTTCQKCCAEKVRKLVSSPAFQFKGSGWYVTDYARKSDEGGSASGAGKSTAESKGDVNSETKAEATPEAKADTKATTPAAEKAPAAATTQK